MLKEKHGKFLLITKENMQFLNKNTQVLEFGMMEKQVIFTIQLIYFLIKY